MQQKKEQFKQPIGVFDSGYGGLTVLNEIVHYLPLNDFIYLGDNARAPYGNRSFESVYQYTLQCVEQLFAMHCKLVILACNTASAKALRTIQQTNLPLLHSPNRVLGVIRPTSEIVGTYTKSNTIGIFATTGTVASQTYPIEIQKFFPHIAVYQQACPMWVPLIENNEHLKAGADYFVQKYIDALLSQNTLIDTVILGCTHYPLLLDKIKQFLPPNIVVLSQGEIVAKSLVNYLDRHPQMDALCSKNGERLFFTTDAPQQFNEQASLFFGAPVIASHLDLNRG